MKSKRLIFLEKLLRIMAKTVLARHKPTIVAVTGSVGKTTTKESIYKILANFIDIRGSEKNYNNEIGVPLTIIGISGHSRKLSFWLKVFWRWIIVLFLPIKYPKVLVLEMGAYYPGDIKYLCEIAPVSVGVLTKIGTTHLERFKTQKNIIQEKGQLLRSLPSNGLAVFNYDDEKVRKIAEKINVNSISYGFSEGSKMRATDLVLIYESFVNSAGKSIKILKGLSFKLNYRGKIIPVRLEHCISSSYVYGALAAFCVGEYFGINLMKMVETVKGLTVVPGRMNLINGIKNSLIIDDTYNSAPDSLKVAVKTMSAIQANRKIAVLGDMLELGKEEDKSHLDVGLLLAKNNFDYFITVGRRMRKGGEKFAGEVQSADRVFFFDDPAKAGLFLQDFIKPGDLLLIKGSQGLRMEKIVEEIMAQPNRKGELLVRQDEAWRATPFKKN
jgi:UDP-N-acetylmuramoyl-tripeptide--D-alanyl-D-alanine ligase